MHAPTSLAFLYISYCIVYTQNRLNGVPKPTPGYGTVKLDILEALKDCGTISKRGAKKLSFLISIYDGYMKLGHTLIGYYNFCVLRNLGTKTL